MVLVSTAALSVASNLEEDDFSFESKVVGGTIPKEFIPSVEKGFKNMMSKGRLIGFPVVNAGFTLVDGNTHPVDSSDNAFQAAAQGASRNVRASEAQSFEPAASVCRGPPSSKGDRTYTMQRRGIVTGTVEEEGTRVDADVPLAEMFAYSNVIRSATQGKAEFTMEFEKYAPVPNEVTTQLMEKYKQG